jgi:hypothetical protein
MSPPNTERLVFGQWLVQARHLDPVLLTSALDIQNAEKSDTLRGSPRLLGQILLDDFNYFKSRVELNQALIEFEKIKTAIEARKGKSTSQSGSAVEKNPRGYQKDGADRSLFGQFLIEKKKINQVILAKALDIQNQESKETLRQSHRLLGEILMDDLKVFSSRVELNRLLIEYNEFKAGIEKQRTELMSLTRRDK